MSRPLRVAVQFLSPNVMTSCPNGEAVMRASRIVAAIAALVGWAALVLQFVIFADRVGIGLAAWRYIGFFTILSNIAITSIATASPITQPVATIQPASPSTIAHICRPVAPMAIRMPISRVRRVTA